MPGPGAAPNAKITNNTWSIVSTSLPEANAPFPPAWIQFLDADTLIAWRSITHHPEGTVTENLWSISGFASGVNSTLVSTPLYDGPGQPRVYGAAHAIDSEAKLLYSQDGSDDVRISSLHDGALSGTVPTRGAELMCLGIRGGVLRALVAAESGGYDQVTVDSTSGNRTVLNHVEDFAPLEIFRLNNSPAAPAECVWSEAQQTMVLTLAKQDPVAAAFCTVEELYVLTIDESAGAGEPLVVTLDSSVSKGEGYRAVTPVVLSMPVV
jgi:hypothetical protein